MQSLAQLRLVDVPMAGMYPITDAEANALLVGWEHKLGEIHRPYRVDSYVLEANDRPVAVAVSASLVSDEISGTDKHGQRVHWGRQECVELARLAGEPWATRLMIRLWRELCGSLWGRQIAVSYSKNSMHKGNLYRFDGWECIRTDAGSSGGGTWSTQRTASDAVTGSKSLWIWRYGSESKNDGLPKGACS